MNRTIKFCGKRIDNGEWVYGAYFCLHHNDERTHIHHFIIPDNMPIPKDKPIGEIQVEVIPETIELFTSKQDKENHELYSGDVIEMLDGSIALIKYGEFEMYCPIDDMDMDNVGFYVLSPQFDMSMPLGPTESYALKLGNIHDNPELLEVIQNN